jgi:glycosyltransferase involved in cell wall biosynthesis
MFLINDEPVPYVDPWCHKFSQRLSRLKQGAWRIAYFYERPDNSTFRYRVYNMIQALNAAGSATSASYFCLDDLQFEDLIIDSCDAVVLCRAKYSDAINRFVTKSKGRNKRVFYDVDDFVFDTRYAHLILNTLDQDLTHPQVWDFWFAYIGRLGEALRLCDHAIVTNDFLAERVREFNPMPVSVIPNFLNLEQITISDQIYDQKTANNFARNDKIHVGYFSGTPTHNRDFELIAESLAHVFKADRRLVLRGVGYFQLPQALQSLAQDGRVEIHGFRDFVSLQKLIGSTEINIVPLQDNVFTNCKSELKYFEAGVVGTLSIASPTYGFRNAILNGVNGYLANTFDWANCLQRILEDLSGYHHMAARAYEHSRKTYHWSQQSKVIERVFSS